MTETIEDKKKRRVVTTLTLRDPKRFVPGERYRLLLGGKENQRHVLVTCSAAGEVDVDVMEITEYNKPDITFMDKSICFLNPHYQPKYRAPKKVVLPKHTPGELLRGLSGVKYVDASNLLM